MRKPFCSGLTEFANRPDFVFLTGDLGFGALEPLRDAMGSRFLNAGISEQNMVTVAAGLSKAGLRPWVYSIAPFLYARAFEQIRNDVCLHRLPVIMVGNGGGYGYGVMGSTHHALEDYGVLVTLPNMQIHVPAFDGDVTAAIIELMETTGPAYLRLGLSEQPEWLNPPPYAPWRRILPGKSAVVVIVGPLAGGIADILRKQHVDADIWVVSSFPAAAPPEFLDVVRRSDVLLVVEEHTARGGFGQSLAYELLLAGITPRRFLHRSALGYVSGLYGSQQFHRRECGLDAASVATELCAALA
jgi:transketolase